MHAATINPGAGGQKPGGGGTWMSRSAASGSDGFMTSEAAPQTGETCSKSPDFSRTPARHTGSSLVPLVHETVFEIWLNCKDPRRSRSLGAVPGGVTGKRSAKHTANIVAAADAHQERAGAPARRGNP